MQYENKKSHFSVIWISIITAIVLVGGVIFSYFVVKALSLKTSLTVIIDPVVVTASGENHLESARAFTFGKDDVKKYDTHIEAKLSNGQSIEYRFTFENSGETNVKIILSYSLTKQENISINYLKSNPNLKDDEIYVGLIQPSEKMRVVVSIGVVDLGADAYASGVFSLMLDDEGDRR